MGNVEWARDDSPPQQRGELSREKQLVRPGRKGNRQVTGHTEYKSTSLAKPRSPLHATTMPGLAGCGVVTGIVQDGGH